MNLILLSSKKFKMIIKKNNIEKLFKKCSNVSHGIDHLTLNLKDRIPKLSDILSILDLDNSNTQLERINDYSITYTKSISRNWTFLNISLVVNEISYTIFQYLEYPEKKRKKFNSRWSLTLYSTYFRLLERQDISLSFEKVFFWDSYDLIKMFPISRIDYKIDFFFEGDYPFPDKDFIVDARKDTKNTIYTIKKLEGYKNIPINKIHIKNCTITWWDLWARTNKSVFLRMYDKLIDSRIKWKIWLYDDYFKYGKVYRLEWEFRTKFNKHPVEKNRRTPLPYTYKELSELEKKCMEFFQIIESWIKKFTYQYKENEERDSITARYFREFWWRACKIALMNNNPFRVILNQFLYIEDIKKQISKDLLETLILDFEQHKNSLIKQKILFSSYKWKDGNDKKRN